MSLRVLYADNHLLAVSKPAGQGVAPDESGDTSLLEEARAWLERERRKPGRAFLGLVHRLDRPVSGAVVFACTSKAAARLSQQFRAGSVRKLYWAVGQGVLASGRGTEGTLVSWLRKDAAANRVRAGVEGDPKARLAHTRWRVLQRAGGRTCYAFEPQTGRAHQLRVAAASLGTPLLGDLKYGAERALPDRSIALHARALELRHPTLARTLRFEAPWPERDWWRGFPSEAAGFEGQQP